MNGPLSRGVVEGGVPVPFHSPTPVLPSRLDASLARPALVIHSLAAALLVGLGVGGSALGATPIGSEFQVNTYTTSNQEFPSVDSQHRTGSFVVSWHSYGSARHGHLGRLVHPGPALRRRAATPWEAEFQVNTYTTSAPSASPRSRSTADGNFVVMWDSDGSCGQRHLGHIGPGPALRRER